MELVGVLIENHRHATENFGVELAQVDPLLLVLLRKVFQCGNPPIALHENVTAVGKLADLNLIHWKVAVRTKALDQILDILVTLPRQ
jgi:hypothetical protein